MAASANPSGNHHQEQSTFNGGDIPSTSMVNSGQGNGNSGSISSMKHNPGIEVDWSAEEQSILENGLNQYASVPNIIRYAKIALELPKKTVRDVALRARWMNAGQMKILREPIKKKEVSKRRKEDHARKNKDKREKVTESTSKSSQLHTSKPSSHPYAPPAVPLDDEDGISCKAIGGPTGELLAENHQFFQQISSNFSSYQIQDNINLFCQARNNLFKIMNSCSVHDTPEIMEQMPPLPVKLNEELANTILPTVNHQKPS